MSSVAAGRLSSGGLAHAGSEPPLTAAERRRYE